MLSGVIGSIILGNGMQWEKVKVECILTHEKWIIGNQLQLVARCCEPNPSDLYKRTEAWFWNSEPNKIETPTAREIKPFRKGWIVQLPTSDKCQSFCSLQNWFNVAMQVSNQVPQNSTAFVRFNLGLDLPYVKASLCFSRCEMCCYLLPMLSIKMSGAAIFSLVLIFNLAWPISNSIKLNKF